MKELEHTSSWPFANRRRLHSNASRFEQARRSVHTSVSRLLLGGHLRDLSCKSKRTWSASDRRRMPQSHQRGSKSQTEDALRSRCVLQMLVADLTHIVGAEVMSASLASHSRGPDIAQVYSSRWDACQESCPAERGTSAPCFMFGLRQSKREKKRLTGSASHIAVIVCACRGTPDRAFCVVDRH